MLPSERRTKILMLFKEQDVITISELMNTFEISIETVRRDLNLLEKQGKIEKVYGGAKLKQANFDEPTMDHRMTNRLSYKEIIGKKCAEFIEDGDCVFIDSGSTTYQIAKHIKDKKRLTIITNSLPVVNELSQTDFDIIIIGGRFRNSERSIVSFNYLFNFDQLNIQKCFLCASGITTNGISDYSIHEVETRKIILKRSREVFVAADSSKFGLDVLYNVATIDSVDHIITDQDINQHFIDAFEHTSTELCIAKK